MAYRRNPFEVDEYYHCYSRGIDKRVTFDDKHDYERFIQLLYACNDNNPFRRDELASRSHNAMMQRDRGEPLTSVLAYCLMPNHFHILLRECAVGGITKFMQKLGTAYTMYFNAKNDRIGGLFVKPFRSKHIHDDIYLKRVIPYIHLNPAELYEPKWKQGVVRDMRVLASELEAYRYSSLHDYAGHQRIERSILDWHAIQSAHDTLPAPNEVIRDAAEYYTQLRW